MGQGPPSDILTSRQTRLSSANHVTLGYFYPASTQTKTRCSSDNRRKTKKKRHLLSCDHLKDDESGPGLSADLAFLQRGGPSPTTPLSIVTTREKCLDTYVLLFSLQIPTFQLPGERAFICYFAPPELSRGMTVMICRLDRVSPRSGSPDPPPRPSTSEHDHIWSLGLYRGDSIKRAH